MKRILAGDDVTARGAYANPDSLDLYKNLSQLEGFWWRHNASGDDVMNTGCAQRW